ncbi:MAG: glycosyltransferase family 9 protein, partial [Planctomycetota bacterium]|nr:glycosyltransferase family 9 protein [Planctomycetota bacterium]
AHIAAAVGAPLVVIFGGDNYPNKWLPVGPAPVTTLRHPTDCSPCFRETCLHRKCLDGITVEKVFDEVKRCMG